MLDETGHLDLSDVYQMEQRLREINAEEAALRAELAQMDAEETA